MSSWILGLALGALAAVLAVAYLWLVVRPRTENAAGLRAVADLRWREFATIVGQAMQQRGLRDVAQGHQVSGEPAGGEIVMTDGVNRWLLSCKHGMAYNLGAANVQELAASMDLAGARNGILLTEGRAERDALAAAAERGIELIDGRRLWPLLKPFMPVATTNRIVGAADAQAKRHTGIALGGALALGLVVAVVLPQLYRPAQDAPVAIATPAPAAATPDPPAAAVPVIDDGSIQDNPDEATEARYQADIARTLSMVPGITRAYWLTRATLVIDRTGTDQIVWPFVCAELDRYPSLRTVRVQLNPRPGSEDQVRWRQCRTF